MRFQPQEIDLEGDGERCYSVSFHLSAHVVLLFTYHKYPGRLRETFTTPVPILLPWLFARLRVPTVALIRIYFIPG